MFFKVASSLFLLLLIAGVPTLSLRTARRTDIAGLPRSTLYFSAVTSQWILAALGAAVIYVSPWSFSAIGLHALAASVFLRWSAALSVLSLAVLGLLLFLELRGYWPETSDLVYLLLPETRREKVWAALLVAPTAALCEEFLYRGYLLTQLRLGLHSDGWGLGACSAAFGLAHIYQGAGGLLRAALLGALLAYPVVRTGSLYPSMAAHFVVDGVALLWLGPRLRRGTPNT